MTTPQPTSTPDDLQARLHAAGVTDDASLHAALERDPQLKADFEAYLASPEYRAAQMNSLLKQFVAVGDPEQLREFWREVPAELEQPLIEIVEAHIAASEISGRSALSAPTAETAETAEIESLRAKLADFKRMCDEAEQVRRAESDIQNLPPVQRAVVAFCQAPDEAAARAWFASQGALLQPFEAQQALDALAAQTPDDAPAEVKQRLAGRTRHDLTDLVAQVSFKTGALRDEFQKIVVQERQQGEQGEQCRKQRQEKAVGYGVGSGRQVKAADLVVNKNDDFIDRHLEKTRQGMGL